MMQVASACTHGLLAMPLEGRACSGARAGFSGYSRAQRPWTCRRLQSSVMMTIAPCLDRRKRGPTVRAAIQEKDQVKKEKDKVPDVDETTRKMGLEAGLWQIFTSKDDGQEGSNPNKTSQAKDLLTRYGGAYLATSISLSLVSFGLCYVLVNNGIDVAALLEKVGINTNATGEKVGTFALAYAAHKAASPIRFPPTVALTPIVAGWFRKKPAESIEEEKKS